MRISNINNVGFKALAIINDGTRDEVAEIKQKTNASSQGLDEVDGHGYFPTRYVLATGKDDTEVLMDILDRSFKEMDGDGALTKALENGDKDTMLRYVALIRRYVEEYVPKIPEFSAKDVVKGLCEGTFDVVNLVFKAK